jgi:hypothetical protein
MKYLTVKSRINLFVLGLAYTNLGQALAWPCKGLALVNTDSPWHWP